MNWRYLLGKSAQQAKEGALRHRFPGTRYFPAGRVYPFDIRRIYDSRKLSPAVIVDAGANIGQTCLYLTKWFPAARIYSLEPVRTTWETLVKNTGGRPNICCRHLGLGEVEGVITIPLMRNSELNSLMTEPGLAGEASGAVEQVRITTLAEFFRAEQLGAIDLLKMDVEGYEMSILKGAGDVLERTAFVLAEVSLQTQRANQTPFACVHDFLRSRNFFFCGLYEEYRHGNGKLLVSFANALYVNTSRFD